MKDSDENICLWQKTRFGDTNQVGRWLKIDMSLQIGVAGTRQQTAKLTKNPWQNDIFLILFQQQYV